MARKERISVFPFPTDLPTKGWFRSGPRARALIEAAGTSLLFLPPYSPDFNPIENAFARLKALLRKAAKRTVDGLWAAIGRIADAFTPTECANYFSACGGHYQVDVASTKSGAAV